MTENMHMHELHTRGISKAVKFAIGLLATKTMRIFDK